MLKAVENGDLSKLESILQKKTINPTKLGIHGFSIFHVASRYGHDAIVERLLDYGAEVNSLTIQGSTALHLASGSGHAKVVDKLIKAGAELNVKDGQQLTALHHACMGCYQECVQILLANKADFSMGDQTGRTALFYASMAGQVGICKDLLDKGANINCVDNNQMTPLMGAANRGRKEVCELLLKKGANKDLTDIRGWTALQHAEEEGHSDLKEVFDKAPTRASWDIQGSTLDRKKPVVQGAEGGTDTSEMPEADQVDVVASFVADNTPSPGPQRKEETLQQAAKKASSQPLVDQKVLQADVRPQELEEENDQLNDELHKMRIQNIKNQDTITSLQNQLKEKSKETQDYEQKIKDLKNQMESMTPETTSSHFISNTLTESTDDGIDTTGEWNDSEEELFGSLKRGKKSGSNTDTDDKQLIALLRSQILTYQSENEQLKKNQDEGDDSTPNQEVLQKMEAMEQQLSELEKHRQSLQSQVNQYKLGNNTDQFNGCSALLEELLSSKYQDIVEPFCSTDWPGVTLNDIQESLGSGKYSSVDDFVTDIRSIIKTSSESEDNQVCQRGQELEKIFEALYKSSDLGNKNKSLETQQTDDYVSVEHVSLVSKSPVTSGDEMDQLKDKNEKLMEQNLLLRQDLDNLQSTYEKLVQAGDNLQDMYDQLLVEKDQQFSEIEKLAREKEEIVKENEFLLLEGNAMHNDLEKLVQEVEDMQEQLKLVQGDKEDLERKLGAVNIPAKASEMAKIIEERDKLKKQCQELQTENDKVKHDHEIVLEEVQSMQEQCNQLQIENEQMTQDFETAQEEFDQLTQQHEGLQQDYNQLEQDYQELLADKEKLETEFLEVQTASVKEQNPLAEEETEELKQENEMLTYEKDQLEMTIKELSKNNALLEEKLERSKAELAKTLEKLKKEASLRVKQDTDASTDKEKQIKSLQVQVQRLQQQLAETDRRHMDIVNTYRTHLISAVQGHMDEDVQQALYNIIELRSMEEFC